MHPDLALDPGSTVIEPLESASAQSGVVCVCVVNVCVSSSVLCRTKFSRWAERENKEQRGNLICDRRPRTSKAFHRL